MCGNGACVRAAPRRLENLILTPRPQTLYIRGTCTAKNLAHVWVKINYYGKDNANHCVYRAGT